MLNFSPASENNKHAIFERLCGHLDDHTGVLEIGSGSGQHAFYFAERLPGVTWQTSELTDAIAALDQNVRQYGSENVARPILLDVCDRPWSFEQTTAVFTANTLHIMPWTSVVDLFSGVDDVLSKQGLLCIYGPFKYEGEFTTRSNADFDQWLKRNNPHSGIRDFEAVDELATAQGMSLIRDYSMPANNQLLIFKRV